MIFTLIGPTLLQKIKLIYSILHRNLKIDSEANIRGEKIGKILLIIRMNNCLEYLSFRALKKFICLIISHITFTINYQNVFFCLFWTFLKIF